MYYHSSIISTYTMNSLPSSTLLSPPPSPFLFHSPPSKFLNQRPRFPLSYSTQSKSVDDEISGPKPVSVYNPSPLDDLFLSLFRNKMVKETGWDSEKPGYDGLIEVANKLMLARTSSDVNTATVRILRSLFPPFLLDLYRLLITPIGGGRLAAVMVARVTAVTCQWLMGPCQVNSINLPDGSTCASGVFVERCKYLEESNCVGVCINTCKIPTQTFFKDYMGIPLLMEPKFSDYSCQFNFGIPPPPREDDSALNEPCLEICPSAARIRGSMRNSNKVQCPKS